jgi:hypothetical protein
MLCVCVRERERKRERERERERERKCVYRLAVAHGVLCSGASSRATHPMARGARRG